MNKTLEDLLLRLKRLRPDTGQFVFFARIYPRSVISTRKAVLEFKKKYPEITAIDFVIYSGGGSADDAFRMVRMLRKNFAVVNVIIPFWAKSAATLLALGGSSIVMDEFGEFGPLDAQLAKEREDGPEFDSESALNDEHSVQILENRFKLMYEQMYIRLYEHEKINIPKMELSEQLLKNLSNFFKPLLCQIDPYKLGEKQRILDIGAQYAKRILLQFGSVKNQDSGRELVDYLIHECPDHGYVIDKDVMENFVTNIHESDIFGKEYGDALRELSMFLMAEGVQDPIVEFVEEETNEEESSKRNESSEATETKDKNKNLENLEEPTSESGEEFAQKVIEAVGAG